MTTSSKELDGISQRCDPQQFDGGARSQSEFEQATTEAPLSPDGLDLGFLSDGQLKKGHEVCLAS